MDKVQQRVLIFAAGAAMLFASAPGIPHFYPDDPLWHEPKPLPVQNPLTRDIDPLYDFAIMSVATPGVEPEPVHAVNTNTVDEVPDSLWYTNRNYRHPMTIEQLRQGATRGNAPVPPFKVVGAKLQGVTPGFQMKDARGRRYLCKPDAYSNPELSTAADVITSRFFYALGYNVPENYIAYFTRDEISIDPKASITPPGGKKRSLYRGDLEKVLERMRRDREGRYRIMASLYLDGKPIGPFRWTGTRDDDPNDIYPHQDRRDLRGIYVFAAWLNHTDMKAGNTLDTVVDVDGVPAVRHHLIDFGSSLGTDAEGPKDARFGHAYMIEKDKSVLTKMFGLGLYSPGWERIDYKYRDTIGRLSVDGFDPDTWHPDYPVPAFLNRRPDDDFWAAKQVMAFTDDQIRAIAAEGEFTNPEAPRHLANVLIGRRDKIGRTFFAKVLPLDKFAVRNGTLEFADLAADHGFAPRPDYEIRWYRFDNSTGAKTPIAGATGARVPAAAPFVTAEIRAPGGGSKMVAVYLREGHVVGIERKW